MCGDEDPDPVVEVTFLSVLERLRDLFRTSERVRSHLARCAVKLLRVIARVLLDVRPRAVRQRGHFLMERVELPAPINLLLDHPRMEDVRAVPARLVVLGEEQAGATAWSCCRRVCSG